MEQQPRQPTTQAPALRGPPNLNVARPWPRLGRHSPHVLRTSCPGVPFSRLSLILVLLLLPLVLTLLAAGVPSTRRGRIGRPRRQPQTITLAVLPPIAQPGVAPAAPRSAQTVVSATLEPQVRGRTARLEVRRSGHWSPVATARSGPAGRVTFTAPTRVDGAAATYRVHAAAYEACRPSARGRCGRTRGAIPPSSTTSTARPSGRRGSTGSSSTTRGAVALARRATPRPSPSAAAAFG